MNLDNIENRRVRTILQFSIPSILAMVMTSLVTVVDGLFIGRYVGEKGLAAVNLGLPIVYLYLAVGLMISVGGVSIAGRLLGAQKKDEANGVFRQTMVVCAVVTIIMTVFFLIFLGNLSELFHTDELTRGYFVDYYRIILFELPMMVIISSFGMFIRGEGNPVFVMLSNLLTVVLNTILDYVFIVRMDLGVKGVGAASVCAAGLVMLLNVLYFLRGKKVFRFGQYIFSRSVMKETLFNGSSEFIGELAMCLSMATYNYVILKEAGVDGIAAFTIIGYVSYVFSMVIVGFGQGIVPIISYSYGAKRNKLAIDVRNSTIWMVVGSALFVFVIMSLLARWYSGLFSDSREVVDMIIPGLRIQMSSFAFAGFNTIASFYFTSIGKAKESAVISSSRGLIVLMIAIAVLPEIFGITGVWLVSLVTEVITLVFSLIFFNSNKHIELERR